MHRDNWDAVFENQDIILKQLKSLENEMFLAGVLGYKDLYYLKLIDIQKI